MLEPCSCAVIALRLVGVSPPSSVHLPGSGLCTWTRGVGPLATEVGKWCVMCKTLKWEWITLKWECMVLLKWE